MTVAVLSALAVAMVGVSALVVNRGVKRNRRKSSTRTRSEPAPFLIFKLDHFSSAELADVPTPAWPGASLARAHANGSDATFPLASERAALLRPEPGLADVRAVVRDEEDLNIAGGVPRGIWVEASPVESPRAHFRWPIPPQRAD
ncbi:MAG: hypothetical protein M3Z30_11985 [Gemmatimonadota bacterium]|nr:hypothetical protein [Gemmatimonadota bacterium]